MNTREKILKLKILKEEFAKKQVLLAKAKKLNEQINATSLSKLLENDLEQAKLILAARDVLDKLQKIAEHLAELGAEEIMPLADSMKGAFGPEAASTFEHAANTNIQKALETVRAAKDSINTAILQVEGKLSPQNDMNNNTPGNNMGNDMSGSSAPVPTNNTAQQNTGSQDPFGGATSTSGPSDEPLGRAKKESIEHKGDHMKEGKSYKRDDEDDDLENSRKKASNVDKRNASKRKEQDRGDKMSESISLTESGVKLLEKVDLKSLMNWVILEASKTMNGSTYNKFVANVERKASANPAAMAGWIGKKIYGESAMMELVKPKGVSRSQQIAEAIAKMIETNVSIFGKGRAAKVLETYLNDTSLMEHEGNSILETFQDMYGMDPARYSITVAKRMLEADTLTPQDQDNANSAIASIATKMASNPSMVSQPTTAATSALSPQQQTALQKVAGVTPGDNSSTSPSNVGQLVKAAGDNLNKNKMTGAVTTEAAMQTDAGQHKANTNRPKLTTSAKTNPMKPNRVAPLASINTKNTVTTGKKITKEDIMMIGEKKLHHHTNKHHKHPDYVAGVGAYYVGLPRTTIISGCNEGRYHQGYDAACDHDADDAPAADASATVSENVNAANWPTDTKGQYKGTPMSTDYGKHKATTSGGKADYKSTGPNADPEPPDQDRVPATTKASKDSLIQSKGNDNQSSSKKISSSNTNAKDTVNKNSKKERIPESDVFEEFNNSYEEEILEAAKKGKIPPQFLNKTKADNKRVEKTEKSSPKPYASKTSKKGKAADKEKAVA